MIELTSIIQKATARITTDYFRLRIDGGDPIYRERVYCYELYHQMRLCWPSNTEYYLNGEIDKAAHPILRELGVGVVKPDLLIHKPGYMSGNFAIIEVKPTGAHANGIRKDLRNLSIFKSKVGYQRAIYIIYGYEAADEVQRIIRFAGKVCDLEEIELWLHERPGEQASLNQLIQRTSCSFASASR
jgi:hypothetical protein